jgi:hypothetical protein
LTVSSHYFEDELHGGTSAVLIHPDDSLRALEYDTWIGTDVGRTLVWDDGRIDDGLKIQDHGIDIEFFCQVRQHHDLVPPNLEISHPFLWYWDAFERKGNWYYLNAAGRDQPLVRASITPEHWAVQIQALELRHYLAARSQALVVQIDHVVKLESQDFDRADSEHRSDWVHATWHAVSDRSIGDRPHFSRLLAQYVIQPLAGVRTPRWEERDHGPDYQEFQYGTDPETSQPLVESCDPDALGTYFDDDPSRLHYLTPVYFDRNVLARYSSEPSRYNVTSTRLSCLDLWGVDISINTAGQVEVYLGDIGSRIPPSEWPHWKAHNVAPAGQMAEHRFRRDFLNQPASSNDHSARFKRARRRAGAAYRELFETPVWREQTGTDGLEFERLHGPTSIEAGSLKGPVLIIAKAVVDAIDPAPLRAYLGDTSTDRKTIELLERVEKQLGGDGSAAATLRDLYRFRSTGIAHLGGHSAEKAADRLGVAGSDPIEAFEIICKRVSASLESLADLFETAASGDKN